MLFLTIIDNENSKVVFNEEMNFLKSQYIEKETKLLAIATIWMLEKVNKYKVIKSRELSLYLEMEKALMACR